MTVLSRVCLKPLRKLHLDHVEFRDEESVCNLLCGCTSLKDLFVRRKSNIDVETFTIAVPTLQRLTIKDYYPGEGNGGYVINAPSLRYLNIDGFEDLQFCLIENSTELVEAKIINVSNITNENILASLTSAKRLTLDLPPLEVNLRFRCLQGFLCNWANIVFCTNVCLMHRASILLVISSTSWYLWSYLQKKECGGTYFRSCLIVLLNCKYSSSST